MPKFGRLEKKDERDYSLLPLLANLPSNLPSHRYWYDRGWMGYQGNTPQCVAYAWLHYLEDGPILQSGTPPCIKPSKLYSLCQQNDDLLGEDYNGTTVRAGAKVLKLLGYVSSYYFADVLDNVIEYVSFLGPMVVGTKWLTGMMRPDSKGLISAKREVLGGHAYVINGISRDKGLFRIKNSWKNWGLNSRAFISFSDFAYLLSWGGEACIATEVKKD